MGVQRANGSSAGDRGPKGLQKASEAQETSRCEKAPQGPKRPQQESEGKEEKAESSGSFFVAPRTGKLGPSSCPQECAVVVLNPTAVSPRGLISLIGSPVLAQNTSVKFAFF